MDLNLGYGPLVFIFGLAALGLFAIPGKTPVKYKTFYDTNNTRYVCPSYMDFDIKTKSCIKIIKAKVLK